MDSLNQYNSEYRHAIKVWKIVPALLLVLGTFGNVLTIIVLIRFSRNRRISSTKMYLFALAISDLLVLWTGLLRQWITYVFDVDVRNLSVTACKIHIFLVYFATQCSSWLLVAVTAERFICVCLPHKVKHGCIPRVAAITISVIVLCLVLFNVHWFYGMSVDDATDQGYCSSLYNHYSDFLDFVWPWIDLCLFCLVPFTILLLCNVYIIVRVLTSKHNRRNRITMHSGGKTENKCDKFSHMTVMLIILNIVFFICTTPISIYTIGEAKWINRFDTAHDSAVRELWWAVVNTLMYLNNALNFILYFLSGSRFRKEVKALFCCDGATLTRYESSFTARRRSEYTQKEEQTGFRRTSNIFVLPNLEATLPSEINS